MMEEKVCSWCKEIASKGKRHMEAQDKEKVPFCKVTIHAHPERSVWCSCCIVHSNSTIVLGSDQVAYPCFCTRWLGLRNLNIVPDWLPLYNCSGHVFHS